LSTVGLDYFLGKKGDKKRGQAEFFLSGLKMKKFKKMAASSIIEEWHFSFEVLYF